MKFAKYSVYVIIFGAMACSSPKIDNVIDVNLQSKEAPSIDINHVIPLSIQDNALISSHYRLCITSKYYIIGEIKKIVVFTKEGKIYSVIDAIGNGPGEVHEFSHFWADDESILIMNVGKKQILEFDFTGRYVKTTELSHMYGNFARFNSIYLFDDQVNMVGSDSILVIADKEMHMIRQEIQAIAKGYNYGDNSFQITKEYALYLPSFNNTIYKINKIGVVIPYYTFNFGSYWASMEDINRVVEVPSKDSSILLKYFKQNDKVSFLKYIDSPDWIILNFEKQNYIFNWFFNKNREQQYVVKFSNNEELNSLLQYNIVGTEGGLFIALVSAFNYQNIEGLPKINISDEDNPILVFFKLNNP
ncbi:hypothetical protein AGMMS49574_00470 [Bacteroidia bacterium]|nr:hypothetical protein AGMMS49574_00470 [Bacteroidia bacterium]